MRRCRGWIVGRGGAANAVRSATAALRIAVAAGLPRGTTPAGRAQAVPRRASQLRVSGRWQYGQDRNNGKREPCLFHPIGPFLANTVIINDRRTRRSLGNEDILSQARELFFADDLSKIKLVIIFYDFIFVNDPRLTSVV